MATMIGLELTHTFSDVDHIFIRIEANTKTLIRIYSKKTSVKSKK